MKTAYICNVQGTKEDAALIAPQLHFDPREAKSPKMNNKQSLSAAIRCNPSFGAGPDEEPLHTQSLFPENVDE